MMIGSLSFTLRKAYLRWSNRGFILISGGYLFKGGILIKRTKASTSGFVVAYLDNSNLSLISSSRHFVKVCLLIISGMAS